jgi:hypothetical protein
VQVHGDLASPLLPQGPKVLLHAALQLIREHNSIFDVQLAEFGRVIDGISILVPYGHTFVLDRLDLPGLDDFASLASKTDNVAVQMRNVACPVAHPCLPQRQDLTPEEISALPTEEGTIQLIRVVIPSRFLLHQGNDKIASNVVGARIGFVLINNSRVARGSAVNLERDGDGLAHDSVAAADGTLVLNGLSTAATLVTLGLDLLVHAGSQLVLDDSDSVAATVSARLNNTIGRSSAVTFLADLLLLPLELGLATVIKVAQGNANLDLNVVAARLSPLVVAASTEEAAEQVKGVVVASASLLPLLQSLMAILVINLSRLGIDESFVGF